MLQLNLKDNFPFAFPKLTASQLKSISEVAECKTYKDGEVLIKAGEIEFKCHVIQKGQVEIIDRTGDEPRVIVVHDAYEFTGDLTNLAGRVSNVDAIAKGTVEVYEICYTELRNLLSTKPELSDIILNAFIARARALRDLNVTGIRVIGPPASQRTYSIRDFLTRNRVLFTWVNSDTDPAIDELQDRLHIKSKDFPVVAYGNEWLLRNPDNATVAKRIGLKKEFKDIVYDLAIVGAGPAGLAAAVYGASEGLETVVLESTAAGGQAGTSSKIENYLGFPTGISGTELATRATLQAGKFGALPSIASKVTCLKFENGNNLIEIESGEKIKCKTLLIATGAEYKRLNLPNLAKFEGKGIYYAATVMEGTICAGEPVAVVGGGNSAGQAAVFLSSTARRIYVIIRGKSLSLTMSNYLIERINQTENIEVLTDSEITEVKGDEDVESVSVHNNLTGETVELKINSIFSFIGATPNTAWLPAEIERDENGFVLTGPAVMNSPQWHLERHPFLLETSCPGIFAAGDVRSSSAKRVSSAVGEGSMTVQFVHERLKEI